MESERRARRAKHSAKAQPKRMPKKESGATSQVRRKVVLTPNAKSLQARARAGATGWVKGKMGAGKGGRHRTPLLDKRVPKADGPPAKGSTAKCQRSVYPSYKEASKAARTMMWIPKYPAGSKGGETQSAKTEAVMPVTSNGGETQPAKTEVLMKASSKAASGPFPRQWEPEQSWEISARKTT